MLRNLLLVSLSIMVSLGVVEAGLRLVPDPPKLPDYRDAWRNGGLGPGGFLQENFVGRLQDGFGGRIEWTNNSQGFRNRTDFASPRPPKTFRILSMGDSFTGGYRVGQEDTFSYLLEDNLQEQFLDRRIEVMVSVTEDPATGLIYLARSGIDFEPDLVLLGITLGNDFAQSYANVKYSYTVRDDIAAPIVMNPPSDEIAAGRAALQHRTLPASCLVTNQRTANVDGPHWADIPGWEHVGARRSRIDRFEVVRLVRRLAASLAGDRGQTIVSNWEEYENPRLFDSNGLGFFLHDTPPEIEAAYASMFRLLLAYRDMASANGIDVIAVIFPNRYQVQARDWQRTQEVYGLKADCFDLELANTRIMEFCKGNGITCIDPTSAMRQTHDATRTSLYLPHNDMHWNAQGHREIADALAPSLKRIIGTRPLMR